MTSWDEGIIEAYERKWLDPDYDLVKRRYRSDYEEEEKDEREMPLTDEESWEEELRILEHMKETIRRSRIHEPVRN